MDRQYELFIHCWMMEPSIEMALNIKPLECLVAKLLGRKGHLKLQRQNYSGDMELLKHKYGKAQ